MIPILIATAILTAGMFWNPSGEWLRFRPNKGLEEHARNVVPRELPVLRQALRAATEEFRNEAGNSCPFYGDYILAAHPNRTGRRLRVEPVVQRGCIALHQQQYCTLRQGVVTSVANCAAFRVAVEQIGRYETELVRRRYEK